MRRSLGMKVTFILALVGFSAVMSVAFAAVSALRVTTDLREQLDRRGESLTANLAHESTRILRISDPLERELSLMLLTHRLIGDVAYVQIVYNGAVVSQSTLVPDMDLGALVRHPPSPITHERGINGGQYVEFVHPLPEDVDMSYVRLALPLEPVQDKVRRNLLDMTAMAILFTALGAAVAFGLYSAILKPLERVVGSIRRLEGGDLGARVHVSSYAELQELGQAFNRMAEVIAERNAELHAVNAELRSANEAKSEFLAMIGHELKTPLHSVRGYCQLLMEELDGPLTLEQRADIEAVLASGNHLLSLIDNILHFSESGSEALHITRLPLGDVLNQALNHVKPLAHQKGLQIRLESNAVDAVDADETKLKQIVINLLHNAVKYTERGTVGLGAWAGEDGVHIEVRDSGRGIPESERERIFEPFERADAKRGDGLPGLGLGLAIVRRYAEAHGGRISVAENPGGGSCFRLVLPQLDASQISSERGVM